MLITLENIGKDYVVHRKLPGHVLKRERTLVRALGEVSFSIDRGEIVGYIGPNGAGKSTTIKIMSGILTPDRGLCRVDGRIPHKVRKEHVRHIGVVFGQRSSLWWDVPVIDSFNLLRDIYGVDKERYGRTLRRLSEMLDLGPLLRTPARQLSLGQRMRCEVAAALLHEPDILFLDEPTIGLDAVSKLAVRDFILEINRERGVTVLLTTHDMHDIEALAKRVMLLGKGALLYDGSLEAIRERYAGEKQLSLRYARGRLPDRLEGARIVQADIGHATLRFDPSKTSAQRLFAQLSQLVELRDVSIQEAPLETVMATLYKEMGL